MFFKPEKKENMKATNNACWITFFFWGAVLFLNSIFELFFNRQFISNSLIILTSGLILFFLTDFILKKRRES